LAVFYLLEHDFYGAQASLPANYYGAQASLPANYYGAQASLPAEFQPLEAVDTIIKKERLSHDNHNLLLLTLNLIP